MCDVFHRQKGNSEIAEAFVFFINNVEPEEIAYSLGICEISEFYENSRIRLAILGKMTPFVSCHHFFRCDVLNAHRNVIKNRTN